MARVHDDTWVKVEEAEVDLHVAVGRLYAAQGQNAPAEKLHALAVDGHTGEF